MDLRQSPPEAQAEFEAVLAPVLAAMPEEVSAEMMANLLASIATEFVNDKASIMQIFTFAANIACRELDRYAAETARMN